VEGQESKTQGLHCKQEERVNVRHTFFILWFKLGVE
jgi:hypothetical protein